MKYNITERYEFTVEGRPRPKERPRHALNNFPQLAIAVFNLFKRNPRINVQEFTKKFLALMKKYTNTQRIYTPKATQDYETLVGLIAKQTIKNKITDYMLNIEIELYFSDKRVGDVDNYTKSILDGLHAIFDDDKQVKRTVVEKYISLDENGEKITRDKQRAHIKIEVLDLPIYYTKKEDKKTTTRRKTTSKSTKTVVDKKPNRVIKKPKH